MDPAPDEASTPADAPNEIVARAGRYYRWTRYIISIGLLIGWGSLAIRDGFFVWPQALKDAQEHERRNIPYHGEKPQTETSIRFQQVLGATMPPLGLALLIWTLYNSRGVYRLSGHTLYVPGHPPVPLESIVAIDKTLWDRKGVAFIEYQLPAGESSTDPAPGQQKLKLDDFVYARGPTDEIVERIEQIIAPPQDDQSASEVTADSDAPVEDEPAA